MKEANQELVAQVLVEIEEMRSILSGETVSLMTLLPVQERVKRLKSSYSRAGKALKALVNEISPQIGLTTKIERPTELSGEAKLLLDWLRQQRTLTAIRIPVRDEDGRWWEVASGGISRERLQAEFKKIEEWALRQESGRLPKRPQDTKAFLTRWFKRSNNSRELNRVDSVCPLCIPTNGVTNEWQIDRLAHWKAFPNIDELKEHLKGQLAHSTSLTVNLESHLAWYRSSKG